jgi:hypothetical protein
MGLKSISTLESGTHVKMENGQEIEAFFPWKDEIRVTRWRINKE